MFAGGQGKPVLENGGGPGLPVHEHAIAGGGGSEEDGPGQASGGAGEIEEAGVDGAQRARPPRQQ